MLEKKVEVPYVLCKKANVSVPCSEHENTLVLPVQQYSFRPSPRPYLGSNQEHINNSHPRSIVTHRSTKAAALAEQGEQLLQGLGASDVTDWNTISAHPAN